MWYKIGYSYKGLNDLQLIFSITGLDHIVI